MLPFSGSVSQDYHPFTSWWPDWFRTTMGQFGFINIEEMKSDDSALEMQIVSEVGSYGMQLGRVVEALQAVCAHLDTGKWAPDEREAVTSFLDLAKKIGNFKDEHQPATQGAVNQIIAALRDLKQQDRATYDQVQEQLRAE